MIERSQGLTAFAWPALAACCRRLVLHSGLADAEQQAAALAGVPLPAGLERWAGLYQRTRTSREEQDAAHSAVAAAWLAGAGGAGM